MIFVTGGTGLVGSHLLHDLIKKGLPVRALRRSEDSTKEVKKVFSYYSENANVLFSKIEWVEGDLLDITSLAEGMNGVSHVYHCAGIVSMAPVDRERMIDTNVTGTANVVNIALEKKIQKLCYISSVASLGIDNMKPITEDTHWNDESNYSAYSISKYLAENEVWRASQEGLNVVIVNPTIILGPGNWHRSSGLIFNAANQGVRWYTSGGMGYVDVRDIVKTMTQLMESQIINQRFIVSSENLSFKKIFELANLSIGKRVPDKKAGKFLLQLAWRADGLRNIITGSPHYLTKEVARYASVNLSYSNAKIKNLLKIDFIPVSDAVKNASGHFLADHNLKNK